MKYVHELRHNRRMLAEIVKLICPDGTPSSALIGQLTIYIQTINQLACSALTIFPADHSSGPKSEDTLIRASLARIAVVTTPELVNSRYYLGHNKTFNAVWVEATCHMEPLLNCYVYHNNEFWKVCLGEEDGPVCCCYADETGRCIDSTFSIYLRPKELTAPYQSGPALARFAFESGRGQPLCDKHAPPPLAPS